MAVSLKNKVVLITGASSGFGKDVAYLFAAEGAKVVLAARRLDRLQRLAAAIQREGGEAFAVPVDVTQRAEIDLMVRTVIEIYEQIDILFNNAGFGRLDWLENLEPVRDIDTQIQVNLNGLIHVTRTVLPFMIRRRTGHIINMSSIAGWIAAPSYTIYAATKYGVRGFTTALRREVAPYGIKVSGIYPGPAYTEFSWDARKNHRPKWLNMFFIPSETVSHRVVQIARYPRNSVIIPWWFAWIAWGEAHFPRVADFLIRTFYTNNQRKSGRK
ncbi:MAG: SDR family NAD(P)-dependent oxidoreductase [Anaerolineales bacterium]